MQTQKIRLGSRKSKLALLQVSEVMEQLEKKGVHLDVEVTGFETQGDIDKNTSLSDNTPDDFFTDTLDQALLDHKIDIAVHSAKDLPHSLREGLRFFALTAPVDESDAFVGRVNFEDLVPGSSVGTSSEERKRAIRKLRPDLETMPIRGTIEERLTLLDQGKADGIIVATAALKRLGYEKRIRNIMPWEAAPLQGQLAVVGRSEDYGLMDQLSIIDVRRLFGRVTLVGAGPGDPQLITLKGVQCLKDAGCVFYDYLIHKDILLHAPAAEKFYVGKRKGSHTLAQEELSRQMRRKAQEGKRVVRLKGGDPFVFGRGADEIIYLKSYHVPVLIVPGVSSATAIPTHLGIPLTARGVSSSVAFVSAHQATDDEVDHLSLLDLPRADTLIFLMGLSKLEAIVDSLKKAGWSDDTPVMVVSRGTCLNQHIVSGRVATICQEVLKENVKPPALILVGEVLKFWDAHPATLERILYTGTDPRNYRPLGEIIHFPMISLFKAEHNLPQVKDALKRLADFTYILFTSRYGVKYFFELVEDAGFPLESCTAKSFIAIGHDTEQALNERNMRPVLVPAVETSLGLLAAMKETLKLSGTRILFPRSSLPNPFLKEKLTALDAHVEELTVYENRKTARRELPKFCIDKIIFTSPSSVKNFLDEYTRIPAQWQILSKGPLTRDFLKQAGYASEVLIYE